MSETGRCLRIATVCVSCLALTVSGQAPSEPLRITTRLVQVSVVASDEKGNPVAGLTQEDFEILDGGKPERIAVFAVEAAQAAKPVPPLPPNVFTNRFARLAGSPTTATIVLFDALNTPLTDQAYARRQILRFLRQLQPEDRVALYVMGRGPRVLQDFTSDSSALVKALENYKPELTPSLEAPLYDPAVSGPAHLDAWLGELTFNLYDRFERDRGFRTVRALVAIAGHLERIPGRKNLIWISGSFPLWFGNDSVPRPRKTPSDRKADWPEIERVARAFHNAGLAVYPVDARGLIAPQVYRADRAEATPETPGKDQAMFTIMRTLADRTGGRSFYSNNDLAAALRRAMEDARLTYMLGYYPSHDSWKGKFREIKVRVKRPGADLHYRRGYFAQPEEPADPWYREGVLEAALWSPVAATGIGLTVQVTPGSGGSLNLALQVDAGDLTLRPNHGKRECALDVWLVQLDQKEDRIKMDARTNNLSFDQATYDRVVEAGGMMLPERVTPEPGAVVLRVLVRDVASGALGSLTVPLAAK
jgi:VWFA-related protein